MVSADELKGGIYVEWAEINGEGIRRNTGGRSKKSGRSFLNKQVCLRENLGQKGCPTQVLS
jgi:hypothetical protein